MKKFWVILGLLLFVFFCLVTASYTKGVLPHVLIMVPFILILKVINGKENPVKPIESEISQNN